MISIKWFILGLLAGLFLVGCSTQPTPVHLGKKTANAQTTTPVSTLVTEPKILRVNYEELAPDAKFPEPTEQELAANALGRIGKPAVPMLVNALRHRDPRVRYQAAVVLAKIGPEASAAAPALTASLDDEVLSVRKAATRALGEIGPAAQDAIPSLMRTLVQPEPGLPLRK